MQGKRFPDETDLLSFFETEPDERFEKGMPIEYQSLTFRFENQDERFVVKMYLGSQEFALKAVRKKDGSILGIYDFKNVKHAEIKKDNQYEKELLIIVDAYGDFMTTVEITFLPFFSVLVKEHFSGE
ncbi:hypothetical protein [Bacillus pumilus]|uniref:Uncharacterized protein n=1 Tax=Bacillus pumilus TaxID=1408 RepID=A0AAD0HLC8_BACPU|nr:hypothetical protein [Bacillus pumilus]AVM23119.1 hypothetical protein C5695_04505 [Bacillus pumilus]TYS44486.1 hypothetical protein FZC68_00650 [Bacillus pumilus]